MEPTPNNASSSSILKRLRGSGSSGRNRPGSRARNASQHDITPTGPVLQQPPTANDFPPLGFGSLPLQDGDVFGVGIPGGNTGLGRGMFVGNAVPNITSILARPPGSTREGFIIEQPNFSQRHARPKSISAHNASYEGDFMGGRRGEMVAGGPAVSSYMGPPQYSRRGNLLPPRPDTSGPGSVIRSNRAPVFNLGSAPNPFAMNLAAGTSLTHRSDAYEISKNFERLRIQGAHLGLTTSPYFPKSKEDLVKHREERKNDAKDAMNQKIRIKEEMMRLKTIEGCEGILVKVKPAFGGKVFRETLPDDAFTQKTIWGHPSLDEKLSQSELKLTETAEWPTLQEFKFTGTRRMGLPIPKYKSGGVAEVSKIFAADRVGLGRKSAGEQEMFDEAEIMELGQMESLFEAIDGKVPSEEPPSNISAWL